MLFLRDAIEMCAAGTMEMSAADGAGPS